MEDVAPPVDAVVDSADVYRAALKDASLALAAMASATAEKDTAQKEADAALTKLALEQHAHIVSLSGLVMRLVAGLPMPPEQPVRRPSSSSDSQASSEEARTRAALATCSMLKIKEVSAASSKPAADASAAPAPAEALLATADDRVTRLSTETTAIADARQDFKDGRQGNSPGNKRASRMSRHLSDLELSPELRELMQREIDSRVRRRRRCRRMAGVVS